MTDRAQPLDEETLKLGLLMESAGAQQQLAQTLLESLRVHARDLDGVVREEIRRTLIEELQQVTAETQRAQRALAALRRGANLRGALWGTAIAVISTAIPAAFAQWILPSPGELATLRARRDQLQASIAQLAQSGGRAEWRHCGDAGRLCVRVDKSAPAYGEKADYFVVKGY